MRIIFIIFLLLPASWGFAKEVQWAHVNEVKEGIVKFNTEEMVYIKGQKYFVIGGKDGKNVVATIEITNIEKSLATAKIISGQVKQGDLVDCDPAKFTQKGPPSSWGLQYQMTSQTMTVKETDLLASKVDNVNMTGVSSGIYGYYNRPLNTWLTLHGGVGYEAISVSGDSSINSCEQFSSTQCNAKIDYALVRGAARFGWQKAKFKSWGELGVSLKHSLHATSTALQADKIADLHTWDLGIGTDYQLSPENFLPLALQYSLYPSNDNVSSSAVYFKIGYGWIF